MYEIYLLHNSFAVHVLAGMYVCGHVLGVFLDYSPLYLLKQSLSLDLYLANSG